MRHLLRLTTALLLGAAIGLSTTCSSLDLGGRYYPLTAEAPGYLSSLASAAPTLG